MNKLHTLLLAFSAMTSAKIWADGPALQGAALQAPALTTSSEAKESPFKKLIELLAKAKQKQSSAAQESSALQGIAQPSISSAEDLVSLVKSQNLSFKDALEKMGVNVAKRFSKRLNGKKGQKFFLNRIKKEGLSWQAAAASLKPATPADIAPANKTPVGDLWSDFTKYLQDNFPADNAGLLMSTLLNSWQSIMGDISNSDLLEAFANCVLNMEDQLSGSVFSAFKTKYKSILENRALDNLVNFQKSLFLKDPSKTIEETSAVITNVFNVIKNNTDDLSKELKKTLTGNFEKAYRLIENSLSRNSFDNADTLNPTNPLTAATYTGLTTLGTAQAGALQLLQEALDYKMDRQGLGRLIYGGKTIAALAAHPTTNAITSDNNFQFACQKLDNTGAVVVDLDKRTQYETLIDNILTKVPAIFRATDSVIAEPRNYAVTANTKNQSLTLQLLAAASCDPIEDHYELTAAEKPGAYYMRQLLNGGAPSDTWLARTNARIYAPEQEGEDGEGRRNHMDEGQENRSESRSARQNNRNDIVWGN
ncbi:MAG: hypothetical protein BGO07_03870 [Alphaproteobacteria bacterium 40-19]|nr:MAG: hypothetical protein BGO07_03870 [Alphaproteobacteria bacterium 40-19]